MKLIYSYLKKFLPDLTVEPQQLRDDLTMIGHFTNYFEEIDGEIVFDLDIKVNRGDCLGYYGLARDLAVFYNLPLKDLNPDPRINTINSDYSLPIQVTTDNVKRVMAIKLSGLKNSKSPDWLKTFIKCHGTNPVNTIVDLTNYIMFLYGISNHAFDTNKSGDNLIWEMNQKFDEFISLDGTKLKINKNILMINNPQNPLSLSFWGGEACAIELSTDEIIIEMAIYNPSVVRQNSRQLKVATEAGTRLEKQLDPELIPKAFAHLIDLILKNCDGVVSSQVFDFYPQKLLLPQIPLNLSKPSLVSGIEIPNSFAKDCLERLGCLVKPSKESDKTYVFTPPSIRPDIEMEADLVEEVIRFWNYQKIPTNEPLKFKELNDITPKIIYLIEKLKDELINLGYDEVLTWPLVSKPSNPKTVITTQNSINTEVVYLRQSLIPSLENQYSQYERYKLINQKFFEIGKIFNIDKDQYKENYSLGISSYDLERLNETIKKITGVNDPAPYIKGTIDSQYFAEIIIDDLPKPDSYTPEIQKQSAYELTSQIITLDANVVFNEEQDPIALIKEYSQKIGPQYLWQLVITDSFKDPNTKKYRYTFRASYFNTDDKTAKSIHLRSFGLEKL
jgi:phenylalanyl-tRNA synthetase beta chain